MGALVTNVPGLRTQPHNIEAEQALLGAILINNEAYHRVSEFLRAEHFYEPVHGRIYAAIDRLIGRGRLADPLMLKAAFDEDEALQEFDGALVLVSHDRHLLRITCDTLLLVDGGRVEPFDGSLDDYPAWLAARGQARPDGRVEADPTGAGSGPGSRRDQRRQDAEHRARLQPLRKRLRQLEDRLDSLTTRQSGLEAQLADPALYADDAKSRLLGLLADKQRVDAELAQVEQDWLSTGEELEAQQARLRAESGE